MKRKGKQKAKRVYTRLTKEDLERKKMGNGEDERKQDVAPGTYPMLYKQIPKYCNKCSIKIQQIKKTLSQMTKMLNVFHTQ